MKPHTVLAMLTNDSIPIQASLPVRMPKGRPEKLLLAAHRLIGEVGLERLTVRAVLTEAGLSRTAFYECYQGKDDLVLALFAQTIEDGARYYRERAQACPDPRAALHMLITEMMLNSGIPGPEGHLTRSIAFSQLHLNITASHPQLLNIALKPLLDLIADLVSQGGAAGLFTVSDPQRTASFVYNVAATATHIELAHPERDSRRTDYWNALAAQVWEFCERALRRD